MVLATFCTFDPISPTVANDGSPGDLDRDEFVYIGLRLADATDIDVTMEANYHADAQEHALLGLEDYRIDERRYTNDVDRS